MERRKFLGTFAAGAAAAGFGASPAAYGQIQVKADRNSFKASDFGVVGDGKADDTAGIQRAIDEAQKLGGATIHLEGSAGRDFRCTRPLDLDGKKGIILSGNPGQGFAANARVVYTGKTGPFISMRTTLGVTLQGLYLGYSDPSFTGPLVGTGHGPRKADTAYLLFDRCVFEGIGKAESLLSLPLCILSTVRNCVFVGSKAAIVGTTGGYSNGIQITDCTFMRQDSVAIRNAGEAWLISGCAFEPLSNGQGAAYAQDAGKTAWGLTILGCWMGDVHKPGGCWIDLSAGIALGLSIVGNRIAAAGTGATDTAIKIGAGNQGVTITGNRIEGPICVDFTKAYCYGTAIMGNDMTGTPIAHIENVIQRFVAGQYTTENHMSGVSNFGRGTFSGDGGVRAPIQLVVQPAPTKPQDGDVWVTSAGMFVRIAGVTRKVSLS